MFFPSSSSVPSQNHNFELNLAILLVSCDMSELWPRLLRNISVLLNGKSLTTDIYCREHKHHSVTSALTSVCPPCSPVPDIFPPSAALKRKELFYNPLVHPLICRRTALPRQMLCPCSHGSLWIFSLFWVTVKTEGCWNKGLWGFWASWAKTRLSFVHNCPQTTFRADLPGLILSDRGVWTEV